MRINALLILGALASTASANTFQFREPDRLDIDRAELALTSDGGELRGTLELVLSTSDPDATDRSIVLGVPRGTEVRTLSVTIADEQLAAVMADGAGARRAYENTVDRRTDPALLEWAGSSRDQTWLRLRVFPVTPGSPATVRLGLGLPYATEIAIDPGELRIGDAYLTVDGDLVARAALDVPLALDVRSKPSAREKMRPQFVRKGYSLVAGPTVIAAREECPAGEVCLRMKYYRVPIAPAKTRTLQARAATHRMRLSRL